VIDKRNHIGGNVYCENIEGINVHKYGAHIFHTSNKEIWDYVNRLVPFNRFTNSPLAYYKGKLYNLPFNMNTFYQLWGVKTPQEAQAEIARQIEASGITSPSNLEEQAISLVGQDIYEKLIKGYTEKQWGKSATDLPTFIIKRLPVRFTYDNNYFNDTYQGIPIGGYNLLIEKLLKDVKVNLGCNFFDNKEYYFDLCEKIIFTGPIDAYYNYQFGELEYRSLRFEEEILNTENYQGNAVINYNEFEIPYTRIIEHKHFENSRSQKTVITKEYPQTWTKGSEPYYPINDETNEKKYARYLDLATQEKKVIFGGRLGEYKYYDMHIVIERALQVADKELNKRKGNL
jgi:UDP-galactopyranose mutase